MDTCSGSMISPSTKGTTYMVPRPNLGDDSIFFSATVHLAEAYTPHYAHSPLQMLLKFCAYLLFTDIKQSKLSSSKLSIWIWCFFFFFCYDWNLRDINVHLYLLIGVRMLTLSFENLAEFHLIDHVYLYLIKIKLK